MPFWTSDRIVSISAMGISLITLVIFVRQTNLMEEQSHLSVMPYLRVEILNDNENHFTRMDIHNYGVGPAIIESREIALNGEWSEVEFVDFFFDHAEGMRGADFKADGNLTPGNAIPAGSSRMILVLCDEPDCMARLRKAVIGLNENGYDFRIRYKSIYGDRWEITSDGSEPKSLER